MTYRTGNPGVIIDGKPMYEGLKILTVVAGHTRPGRLVMRETDDDHVTIAGNDEARVIGFIEPDPSYDNATDFAAEQEVRIPHGPCVTTLTLATGQTIVKGDQLSPAANGMVKAAASDANPKLVVAIARKSVTTSTLATASIVVRWIK